MRRRRRLRERDGPSVVDRPGTIVLIQLKASRLRTVHVAKSRAVGSEMTTEILSCAHLLIAPFVGAVIGGLAALVGNAGMRQKR
jgi:hypothetical protein